MSYPCWGVLPKNDSQKQAILHLLNPDVDLVILQGVAGSGKTLLALAAGLEQVLNQKQYTDILFTRAPVGVGADLGYLPGEIDDKMIPWCGALFDNLDMLINTAKMSKLQKDGTHMVITNSVKLCAMMHMRGRSLYNKWVIVDEVQNLHPSELKVLITRAGEGTKIVLMGDTSQIDNKKLTTEYNALTNVIEVYDHSMPDYVKSITLPEGVRSRLCSWGAECL
ncbi:PhoH Phosphate starvation-inducible protein PhoH, predicted ATPase [uncultured Caudovirales phage]|uniref:PhoH Phosphate starvation-inducible protein PhoH, predicted ATPase n=1 Tax=uncultured Caudovirales phage TaxID=2100421 RepID=A0A6J5KHK4_9CAUD|nr:PhoH Phosphate starvation-inducible protein PhoH, predicted ATPase [uncultured Caudovirales phage]